MRRKQKKCLKVFRLHLFCLGLFVTQLLPAKNDFSRQKLPASAKKNAVGRRPAEKMQAGGKPSVRNLITPLAFQSTSPIASGDNALCAQNCRDCF